MIVMNSLSQKCTTDSRIQPAQGAQAGPEPHAEQRGGICGFEESGQALGFATDVMDAGISLTYCCCVDIVCEDMRGRASEKVSARTCQMA